MVKPKKLSNGMRVHLVPFAGTKTVTMFAFVKVGSRYEPLPVWGGSHFIEHLMFKGTKKRPSAIDISKTLDRYGAEFNAYTGKDLTGYYVKINAEKASVAVELLYDMLFNSLYDAKEMSREKKVIMEEIKMYEENPIMHLEDLLEDVMFEGSTLGRNIAGTIESMRKMKRTDLIAFRDAYYVPSQMVLVMAGNLPKDALAQLEKTFGAVKEAPEPESFVPFGDTPERKSPRIARQYKDLKQIQIGIGFPCMGKGHKDMPALKLLGNILGGTMSSRLFTEVRERRGLAYTVRAKVDAYEDVGVFAIRAGLDASRLDLAMKTVFQVLKKIKKEGVTAEELKYAKENLAGGLTLRLEDSSDLAEFYGRQELFLNDVKTPDELMKEYKQVNSAQIKRLANEVLNFKKMSIAAIGPYKTDKALLKHFPVVT